MDSAVDLIDAFGRLLTPAGVFFGIWMAHRGLTQNKTAIEENTAQAVVTHEAVQENTVITQRVEDTVNNAGPGQPTLAENARETRDIVERAEAADAEDAADRVVNGGPT